MGKADGKTSDFVKSIQAAAKALKASAAVTGAIDITGITVAGKDQHWISKQLSQAFQDTLYLF